MEKITRDALASALVSFAGKEVSYSSLLEVNSGVRIGNEIEDFGLRSSILETLEEMEAEGELFSGVGFELENGVTVDIFEFELFVVSSYYDESGERVYNVFALNEIEEDMEEILSLFSTFSNQGVNARDFLAERGITDNSERGRVVSEEERGDLIGEFDNADFSVSLTVYDLGDVIVVWTTEKDFESYVPFKK